MLRSSLAILVLLATVAACSNYTPRDKVAVYDPNTKEITMPYPCPDWSQSQTHNYQNQPHSNFGCAVNTNSALQLDDPRDLYEGHGDKAPDPAISARVLEQYRAGEIPKPLTPLQSDGTSTGSQ